MHKRFQFLVLLICWAPSIYAYEPQFSLGIVGSQRADEYRYGIYTEYFHEKMMAGNLLGFWPRLEYDTNGSDHALFVNTLTLFGMANLEYAYSKQDGEALHSYGIELNTRFIPAVLLNFYSMRGDRIVRDIEIFGRVHNYINSDGRLYQIGVKLGFYFPGFKVSDGQ
jgi:hypothetical protein